MIKIGVISPSEIALRRFMPALQKCSDYQYVGVAIASHEEWFGEEAQTVTLEEYKEIKTAELKKAESFRAEFGGNIFYSYADLISDPEVDAIYLPLPPALHFKWAMQGLENNKHILLEKPSTTDKNETYELITRAKNKGLAIHENYMFAFHEQLRTIQELVNHGKLGDIRLYRVDFGFPKRTQNDFRYSKALGGGALLDCGGYALKYASILLGESVKIEYAKMNYVDEFEVDLYGSAALSNDREQVVQISFGMDNSYKCELEIWGSKRRLLTGRILTAPAGFTPSYTLIDQSGKQHYVLPVDDTFMKSLQYFEQCIKNEHVCQESYLQIQRQAELVSDFFEKAQK